MKKYELTFMELRRRKENRDLVDAIIGGVGLVMIAAAAMIFITLGGR